MRLHRHIPASILAIAVTVAVLTGTASAATPPLLWQSPEDGVAGSTEDRLNQAEAIAANSTTGHLYVADRRNARVKEYTAWGEFVRAWGRGVRDGSPEFQICGPAEEPPSSCQIGSKGTGSGEFQWPLGGMAIDPNTGHVYVVDMENYRVQVFDEEGEFLFMFGGGVNKSTGADICTAASGNTCGVGVAGEGDGEFATEEFGEYIAISRTSPATVYVGDKSGRIQWFEPDGSFKGKTILGGALAGSTVADLAIDQSNRLYVVGSGIVDDGVYRYSTAGLQEFKFPLEKTRGVEVDADGNVYVNANGREVVEYAPDGTPIIAKGSKFAEPPEPPPGENIGINGLAVNTVQAGGAVNIYTGIGSTTDAQTSFLATYGPPPTLWLPPVRPPGITAQYATSVDRSAATVGAEINPRFWADTSYYVEYGAGKCSEGGCAIQQAPPGVNLNSGPVGSPVATKPVVLQGLNPGTIYHYRFVAQSSGGGPVKGIGTEEEESIFITRSPQGEDASCENRAFRIGPGNRLPDCRAYEMVSPVDKNGDIVPLDEIQGNPASLNQTAVEGGKLTYTTSQGFGDVEGVPYNVQYIATRGATGWSNHAISPPQGLSTVEPAVRANSEFQAFTPDLCAAVNFDAAEPLLAPGAIAGFPNLYRRQNCGEEGYEALTTTAPPTQTPNRVQLFTDVQGISGDAKCTVFRTADQLTPDANPGKAGGENPGSNMQIYESCGGMLRLVSALPNGKATTSYATAGSAAAPYKVRYSSLANAVSADGNRVYWTDAENFGPLYLRENSTQGQSKISEGACSQPLKACTYPVSSAAFFWAASEDGAKALYTKPIDGTLFEFDAATKTSIAIAGGVTGLVGASEDVSRYYLVSREALEPGAVDGDPNIYLQENGELTFVAALAKGESGYLVKALSSDSALPVNRSSRVSPDGRHLVFTSLTPLTGYDNKDAVTGRAAAEVYVYDAESDALHCASCNPSGQRPRAGSPIVQGAPSEPWAAAYVPGAVSQLYDSRAVSDDGKRVYFNSFDALVPGDTNGRLDVYQWELPGSGNCTESSTAYSDVNDGCVSLISSGESPTDSEFVDASPDGTDVFFATDSRLVAQDTGLIDIYDARVGGGYPPPPSPPTACEGEACQGLPGAPSELAPASAFFQGAGNVKETAPGKPRCPKGKHRRKGRCVKKKAPAKKPGRHKPAAKRGGAR